MELKVYLLLSFLTYISADNCTSKSTCRECIQNPGCLWYIEHDNNLQITPGCYNSNSVDSSEISNKFYNPENYISVLENRELTISDEVMLAPQKILFKLRPLVPVEFYVSFNTLPADTIPPQHFENIQIKYLKTSNLTYSNYYEISATRCPKNPTDFHQTIHLMFTGSNLTIEIEFLCDCPCEPYAIPKADRCHRRGTYSCGICECQEGASGKFCECDGPLSPDGCFLRNGTECSGRGNCICGMCECEMRENPSEIISGQYCECDNFSCDRYNEQICGGIVHGICVCGICVCKPGWEGNACQNQVKK